MRMRAAALKHVRYAMKLPIALAIVWSAIGCVAHTQLPSVRELHGERGGEFVLLLRVSTPLAKPGHAESAGNVAELRALWQRYGLPLAPPHVDFERDVVSWISVDGSHYETAELDALSVDAAGSVEPSIRFFSQRTEGVADPSGSCSRFGATRCRCIRA